MYLLKKRIPEKYDRKILLSFSVYAGLIEHIWSLLLLLKLYQWPMAVLPWLYLDTRGKRKTLNCMDWCRQQSHINFTWIIRLFTNEMYTFLDTSCVQIIFHKGYHYHVLELSSNQWSISWKYEENHRFTQIRPPRI